MNEINLSININCIHKEYKNNKFIKINDFKKLFFFHYFVCVFINSLILVMDLNNYSLKLKKIRRLSTYNNSNNTSNTEEIDDNIEVFPYIVLICYVTFIFLSLYMIVMMRRISEKTENLRLEVLKFMYMSNNGYLLVAMIDTPLSETGTIYGIVGIASLILVIGTIIYIVKYITIICVGFFETYFSCEMFKSWLTLPFIYV